MAQPLKSPVGDIDQDSVTQFLQSFAMIHRNGNIDELMKLFSPDLITFDMMPPLQFVGKDAYRQTVERYFTQSFVFPVETEWRDLRTSIVGDLAICYGLYRIKGKFVDSGEVMECWLRTTLSLTRGNGKWLITHVHNSVPVGENGQALMDLSP